MNIRGTTPEHWAPGGGERHHGRPSTTTLTFVASPRFVLRAGLTIAVLLSAASLLGQVLQHGVGIDSPLTPFYADLTDVDFERSIPTAFQALVLAACAAALWTVADDVRGRALGHHTQWRLLSLAFLGLSLDESLALHERATEPVRDALGLTGALYLSWIVVAVPVAIAFVWLLVPLLRALPRWTLGAFVTAGAVYVAGTVGMEMIGGILFERSGVDTVAYSVAAGAEELLEMVGMLLFLAAVSEHRHRLVEQPDAPVTTRRHVAPRADTAAAATPINLG